LGYCAALLLLNAGRVEAQTPYDVDLRLDLPVLGLGVSIGAAGFLEMRSTPACAPLCSTKGINILDRTAIHFNSDSSGRAADVLLYTILAAPLVLDAIDSPTFHDWLVDTLIVVQSVALTQTVAQLTKFAFQRYSPALYGGDASAAAAKEKDAARSFVSAHAASAFSVATAYTVTYWLKHPRDPMRFLVFAIGAALSLTTGILKVLAGAHFWTDVIAGGAVGLSIGVLVPLLHVSLDECHH
jgi:membrane-associated phospholipid phosphatase